MIKKAFDLVLVLVLLPVLFFPLLILAILVKAGSSGPVLYWSDRVGYDNQIFKMPKFRSMKIDAPTVATHLLRNPDQFLTRSGGFLRRYSLDELPQLWCILKGDMSFVGPRPALFNQYDLINARTALGVDQLLPGLTGWAQVNGRDELSIEKKVTFDFEYLKNQSIFFDLQIILLTIIKALTGKGVSH
jgi:O-antigen biosynthesis protein WbqP